MNPQYPSQHHPKITIKLKRSAVSEPWRIVNQSPLTKVLEEVESNRDQTAAESQSASVKGEVDLPPPKDPWDRLEAVIRDVYKEKVDKTGEHVSRGEGEKET